MQSLRNRTYDHYAAIYYLLLEKLKQQKSQENSSSHYLQNRRLSEKLFPAVSYEPQLFMGHSSPNKRASIDCPAGHQYLPDLWKQPKTSAAVHLNSGHLPSSRPRSYSQGRAVQHSVNLADLKSQQHPPFRELPQLPKFKGGKPDKMPTVEMVAAAASAAAASVHDEMAPKMCYHPRLDHTTMMIAPQYSTSTDEGIETDLEDGVASSSPTQPSQRLTYPPSAGPVIKSHSQNLVDMQCAVNQYHLQDSDLVSSLPSCAANEIKYADCCTVASFPLPQQQQQPPPPPPPPSSSSSWDRRTTAAFLAHNHNAGGDGRPRPDNMSPVGFREGRRASDGLMNQIDSVTVVLPPLPSSPRSPQQYNNGRMAFNGHRLQDCGGKTKGLADLHIVQKEHETLKMLYQNCLPNDELQVRTKRATWDDCRRGSQTQRYNDDGVFQGSHQQPQQHGEYRKDVPPRSPSAAMAKRFNYTDGYALDKSGLQQQLLQQRLLQHKRTILQKQGAAFSQCSVAAAMAAAAVAELPAKRQQQQQQQQQHAYRQPLYNKTAQLSPQHSGDSHTQLQSDGSWQSLPHTMATCQINDFDSQANWLSVPDPQHHWYCTSGQQYNFSKNYSQVNILFLFFFLRPSVTSDPTMVFML